METEPSAIEVAAQALRAPGTVRYWTDFLKVCAPTAQSLALLTWLSTVSLRVEWVTIMTSRHCDLSIADFGHCRSS